MKPLEGEQQPGDAAFQPRDPHPRKTVEDAVVDDIGEIYREAPRMPELAITMTPGSSLAALAINSG